MDKTHTAQDRLTSLADYLASRRSAILERWRRAVEDDPALAAASMLARREFYDHIPAVLDAFEASLRAPLPERSDETREAQKARAAEHGLHRWHHGYNQQDVMREWGHLQLCLVDELEIFAAAAPCNDPASLSAARRALARLCSDGVVESATRYAELQRLEAESRIRDLEEAVGQLRVLDRRRSDTWRGAVHDLRGRFGVIKNIADLLGEEDSAEALRTEFLPLLQKSVGSLHTLLNNLLVLSRLEAGQERRELRAMDAALVLKELCESFQPLAAERGLFLHAAGPEELPVQSDPLNIQRIAQNLLLNALKYTYRGGVRVAWQPLEIDGLQRWSFAIEDTGPGFQTGAAAPVAGAIEESTAEAERVEGGGEREATLAPRGITSPAADNGNSSAGSFTPRGEGIGLAIVKRLCDLLDATVELKTEFGRGSTFRVVLPRSYDAD